MFVAVIYTTSENIVLDIFIVFLFFSLCVFFYTRYTQYPGQHFESD